MDESPSGSRRSVLAVFAGINAVAAWFGAIALAFGALSFGDDLDARLPFDSLVLAGLALAVLVAVPLTALTAAAWIGDPRTDRIAVAAGAILVCWIVLQMAVLHAYSWFHPVYLVVGATLVVVGLDGRRRVRGALLALGGCVMVAIGVGFVPYLIDDTVSPAALVAVVLTIGGATAVVVGTRWVLSAKPWAAKLGGGLLALFVTIVSVWMIAPPVAANNVPPSPITTTPDDVGLDAEAVTLTTRDDVELAAWYVAGSNRAAVVVLHGAGSTRSNVLDHAVVLSRNGYGVLLLDARGHGNSEGHPMDLGWYGDSDIAAGTEFLAAQDGVDADRVGVVGMSMGGEEAIGAAAANPAIVAVVAEGATGRTAQDKTWLSDRFGWRGALQEQVERAQSWMVDYLTDASPPIALRESVVASSDTAFFLISAGQVPDEAFAAEHIASAAPERVRVWTVDGADHTGGLDTEPAEWEARVIAFLDTHLVATP